MLEPGSTTIIETPTLEDFISVVQLSLDQNIPWATGDRNIKEYYWKSNGKNTCIIISSKASSSFGSLYCMTYCSRGYVNIHIETNEIFTAQRFCRTFYRKLFKEKYGLR